MGRSYKAEVLKWDGSSVYSTALTTFNGRDQAVVVIQQDNTQSPVVEQTTTMSFDGHGRLKTRHLPQQTANTNTTYNYNADDSLSSVVDARGATKTISYNSRALVDQISYSVPQNSNISVAATIGFTYDALGNRTQMTDGLGNVQYEYNSLSQLVAETRQFNDALANAPIANNKFKLEYGYNLSGRLASIKDPYGKQINYAHDKVGRLNTISGTTFADVTDYLSTVKYRAWNAPKEINYSNGLRMNADFNQRLQAEDFTLTKTSNSTTLMHKQYEYYADGNLRYVEDSLNPKFDRLFKYDFGLRLKQTRTGAEARGETEPDETQIPFRQDFSHTAFGQLSGRTGDWRPGTSAEDPEYNFNYSYLNNRNTGMGFTYDADGRQTMGKGIENVYDSAGKMTKTSQFEAYELEFYFDGNGQEIKRKRKTWNFENEQWDDPATYYYIRSTVLGGETVSEAKDDGAKRQTFVYAGEDLLATQKTAEGANSDRVIWEMWDASRNSSLNTDKNGAVSGAGIGGSNKLELDAFGINVNYPILPSYPWSERGRTFNPYERPDGYQGGGESHSGECYVDGTPTLCEIALGLAGQQGEGIEDVFVFDFPVFSDIAGRHEIAEIEDMVNSLRLEGYEDPSYGTKEDPEKRHWEIDINAGASIYKIVSEQISFSRIIINDPLGVGKPATKGQILQAMNDCAKELWKDWNTDNRTINLYDLNLATSSENGSVNVSRNWLVGNIVRTSDAFIVTDVSLTMEGIATKYNSTQPDKTKHKSKLYGLALKKDPGSNYAANNVPTPPITSLGKLVGSDIIATQIHEIGNSIGYTIGIDIGDPSLRDPDSGQVFENCVEGKLSKVLSNK